MKPNEEGIFTEDEAAYHADKDYEIPSLSSSLAKLIIAKTPAHCFAASQRLNPRYKSKNAALWDKGKIAHKLVLGSDAQIVEVNADDWRTKEARAMRADAYAANKTPVLSRDLAEGAEMASAARRQLADLEAGNPYTYGRPEIVIRWKEEFAIHGRVVTVWCRSRIDWLDEASEDCVDYKSTSASAEPVTWTKFQMFKLGFHYQAAFYRRGLRRLTQLGKLKMHDPNFLFVVQEMEDPYLLSVVSPSVESLDAADSDVQQAMLKWARCLEENKWPGYATVVHVVNEPKWYAREMQMREEHVPSEDIARSL